MSERRTAHTDRVELKWKFWARHSPLLMQHVFSIICLRIFFTLMEFSHMKSTRVFDDVGMKCVKIFRGHEKWKSLILRENEEKKNVFLGNSNSIDEWRRRRPLSRYLSFFRLKIVGKFETFSSDCTTKSTQLANIFHHIFSELTSSEKNLKIRYTIR